MGTYRTCTFGLTHEGVAGFSSYPKEPQMSMLINQRQTELWANNKNPYYVSYAPNGVAVYSNDKEIPWKRREFLNNNPTFEGTRFRSTRAQIDARAKYHATLRSSP